MAIRLNRSILSPVIMDLLLALGVAAFVAGLGEVGSPVVRACLGAGAVLAGSYDMRLTRAPEVIEAHPKLARFLFG